VAPVLFGLAILGSAFLLAWAAEVLQLDVSQGLALTVLALIAVLPEYAVDFTFASKAGEDPDKFAPLALANMTGSNRLLIGVGWSMVVLLAAWRMTRIARRSGYTGEIDTDVNLERPHAIEIAFLAVATLYSLTLPLKRTLTLFDSVILIGIFVVFVVRIARSPSEEPHLVGPARVIATLAPSRRRTVVGILLAYAAGVIFACAEPFAESLVHLGESAGISTFLLVQWVAPLASEAPELIVAGMFAWRLQTSAGFGTLLSSKVNQWTLLVGSLPIVFAVSAGHLTGLPLDSLQREELFLTAAQSVFAIAVLASRSISVKEALALLGLFLGQFVLGGILPGDLREFERLTMGIIYLVLAAGMLYQQRRFLRPLAHDGLVVPVDELFREDPGNPDPAEQLA
jgi:cation:H+ antiporter